MSHKTAYRLSCLLRNCVTHSLICQAKQTHVQTLVINYFNNVTLQTDLLLAYSKCGFLEEARKVFDRMYERNMHSWNIMISSYARSSCYFDAIYTFDKFLKMGFRPDCYTLPPVFKAAGGVGDCYLGFLLHSWVIRLGFEGYVVVGSCLLDFYVKGGKLVEAKRVFSNMSWRDNGVWNLMISGFGRAGFYAEALRLFRNMIEEGIKLDALVVPTALSAYAGEGDLMKGKEIHGVVVKNSLFNGDPVIGNSLIDMYAKCGCLGDSERIFQSMSNSNVVTWTTMISCYGVHGKAEASLALFKKMKDFGCKPNPVTLTTVLASCSHSGLIDEARMIFYSTQLDYGFEPSLEHCACMVDLLGRFGHLEEALGLVHKIKSEATASVWGALLAGCLMHKNVEIGEAAAHRLFQLEPRNSSNYIALCHIYQSHGFSDGIAKIRAKMRELGLAKTPGCSWITTAGTIHKFYQGHHYHPMTKVICETLDGMIKVPMMPDGFELDLCL